MPENIEKKVVRIIELGDPLQERMYKNQIKYEDNFFKIAGITAGASAVILSAAYVLLPYAERIMQSFNGR